MKSFVFKLGAIVSVIAIFFVMGCKKDNNPVSNEVDSDYVVGAYIYHKYPKNAPIEAQYFTQLNYAFGLVNDSLDGVEIPDPDFFERCVALKDTFPHLSVSISLGGANAAGFSQMAADSLKRLAFAADCARIIKQYKIDGIDVDWEFPGNSFGGPEDLVNYVKLIRDIRTAIGPDKLLTIAGGGDLAGVNAKEVLPYLDYINVMAYDLGWAPYHHTSLYRSPLTGWRSVEEVIADYHSKGVPNDKMVIGMGFYGRGDDTAFCGWTDYGKIELTDGMTEQWDEIAKVPYIITADSVMVLGFDNPRSLEIKCDYIKDNGFLGGMYWRYGCDDANGTLRKAVAKNLLVKKSS